MAIVIAVKTTGSVSIMYMYTDKKEKESKKEI